jgi:hypothetical protein
MSLRRIDHSSRGVLPTVARRCVWSRIHEHEKTKACYRAVKIQPQWVVTPVKQTNKQTNKQTSFWLMIKYRINLWTEGRRKRLGKSRLLPQAYAAVPGGSIDLRPLACWDLVFEYHRRHGWMSVVNVVCCLCDGLATRPEESYRLWRVVVCDKETSSMSSHTIKPLWLIHQQDLLAAGDLITLVHKVRHPASTLTYIIS